MQDNSGLWQIVIAVFQAIIILFLLNIRGEIVNLWKRTNNHSHTVKCKDRQCDVEVNGVVIKGGQE